MPLKMFNLNLIIINLKNNHLFSESNNESEQATGRRLTREEDDLEDSDDDGIIVMSGIVSQAEDRKKSLHNTMSGNRKLYILCLCTCARFNLNDLF